MRRLRAPPSSEISARVQREDESRRLQAAAFLAGLAAFTTWGLIPPYWKLLKTVPAPQILAHRFVWTIIFLGTLLTWQRRWPEAFQNLRSRRASVFCLCSGAMIGVNWLLFIWAVNIGRVLETSLGYFMTPILNVLLGAVILRERPTRWQAVSILIALVGVLILSFGYGQFPWVAVALCISFGVYGLLRKQSGVRPVPGLFLETIFLAPLALIYLILLAKRGELVFGPGHPTLFAILATTGIVTGLPLVWFGYAARHLRLITIGFLQYLSPALSFLLGLFLYHETFTRAHFVTFLLIWIALAIVSAEAVIRWRSAKPRAEAVSDASTIVEPGI
jgi:chloramphenicol-sensitive protein RarD